jgi:hypothetical protein
MGRGGRAERMVAGISVDRRTWSPDEYERDGCCLIAAAVVEIEGWLLSDEDDRAGGVSESALVCGSSVHCTAYSGACPSCPSAAGDATTASSAPSLAFRAVSSAVASRVELLLPNAVPFGFIADIVFIELDRERVDVDPDARGAV